MTATVRSNRIIGGDPEWVTALTPRERALRRLRDPLHAIEVLSGDGPRIDVSSFVFDLDTDGQVREYHCSRCGAHLLIYFIQVEGDVRCSCGPIQGTVV